MIHVRTESPIYKDEGNSKWKMLDFLVQMTGWKCKIGFKNLFENKTSHHQERISSIF